ncbi:hypothetical protein C8J56DRAFT_1031210 [Mycena floridula]|nr:hypothetical protein C8J56DRAFT_1031210 [Mycena floridula]
MHKNLKVSLVIYKTRAWIREGRKLGIGIMKSSCSRMIVEQYAQHIFKREVEKRAKNPKPRINVTWTFARRRRRAFNPAKQAPTSQTIFAEFLVLCSLVGLRHILQISYIPQESLIWSSSVTKSSSKHRSFKPFYGHFEAELPPGSVAQTHNWKTSIIALAEKAVSVVKSIQPEQSPPRHTLIDLLADKLGIIHRRAELSSFSTKEGHRRFQMLQLGVIIYMGKLLHSSLVQAPCQGSDRLAENVRKSDIHSKETTPSSTCHLLLFTATPIIGLVKSREESSVDGQHRYEKTHSVDYKRMAEGKMSDVQAIVRLWNTNDVGKGEARQEAEGN